MATSIEKPLPQLRWGILGTGWISSMFVADLLVTRPNPAANHQIVALGSSSLEKGSAFVTKLWDKAPESGRPQVYADYQGVYNDANVDIVYVGTPHSVHKQNCLEAIAAGKHVLCEKPFTINEKDAQEVVNAARAKGVFIMEGRFSVPRAVWTRFFPFFEALRDEVMVKKSIGQLQRFFIDFGLDLELHKLPRDARQRDPSLGAGALLDIGIYTLTYASLIMGEWKVGEQHPEPKVTSSLDIVEGIDYANVVVLDYPTATKTKKTAICTSTMCYRGSQDFARIEGSNGVIEIFGPAASVPSGFRVTEGARPQGADTRNVRVYNMEKPEGAVGFFWEADAVAMDIAAGRTENAIMPLGETLRMLRLMDGIRRDGGLVYPQD